WSSRQHPADWRLALAPPRHPLRRSLRIYLLCLRARTHRSRNRSDALVARAACLSAICDLVARREVERRALRRGSDDRGGDRRPSARRSVYFFGPAPSIGKGGLSPLPGATITWVPGGGANLNLPSSTPRLLSTPLNVR